MKCLFALLLTCGACFGQITFEIVPDNNPQGSSGVTELADTFVTASDTDLTNHVTTTGGYAWVRAGTGGDFTNFTATGNAKDMALSQQSLFYVNHTISSANYTVQADVSYANTTDSVEGDVGGRYNGGNAGAGTAYFVAWFPNSQTAALYKVVGGTPTQLGSNLTTTGTTQTLKLMMSGTAISGYCNGNLIASATDSAIAGPGKIGIGPGFRGARTGTGGSNHVTYDNLLVTVP